MGAPGSLLQSGSCVTEPAAEICHQDAIKKGPCHRLYSLQALCCLRVRSKRNLCSPAALLLLQETSKVDVRRACLSFAALHCTTSTSPECMLPHMSEDVDLAACRK